VYAKNPYVPRVYRISDARDRFFADPILDFDAAETKRRDLTNDLSPVSRTGRIPGCGKSDGISGHRHRLSMKRGHTDALPVCRTKMIIAST
jgi:hypothetical protein